ncbi:MAG: hypothetical protein WDN72_09035 [Alphaproteobacteria bacterium]
MLAPASTYVVYDDPDSKIQFLEETLRGKDWHATILYPDHNEASLQKRIAAQTGLEQRGYLVQPGQDDCGHYTLSIHHLGEGARPSEIYRELGLARGTMHMGSHPILPLRYLLSSGQHAMTWIEDVLHDPAQANGFINLIAEGFLFLGGAIDKSKRSIDYRSPARARSGHLQTLSASLFFLQSFIYLFIAKNNEQITVAELRRKVEEAQHTGADPTQIRFDAAHDGPKHDIGHAITGFIRKYPVQLGALFNDLGMIAYGAHAFHERSWKSTFLAESADRPLTPELAADREAAGKYVNGSWTGFHKDMLGATLSFFAWPLLMLPRKETDEATRKAHEGHPMAQAWDAFRADPERLAGAMTIGASASRLMGAQSKNNLLQSLGEGTYVGGDISLMFTKNDHYGSDILHHVDKLAGKLAQYIETLPVVLGPESQKHMALNMSNFVLEKNLAEEADKNPKQRHLTRDELNERSARLAQAVLVRLEPEANSAMLRLAEAANAIIERFPEETRPQVQEKLLAALSAQPGIHASAAEIEAATRNAIKPLHPPRRTKLVQMKDIGNEVAELAFSVPGLDTGRIASTLYDALSPFLRTQPSDRRHLDSALTQQASTALGIAPNAAAHQPQGELGR